MGRPPKQCPRCGSPRVARAVYGERLENPILAGRAFWAGPERPPRGERPHWGCLECGFTWDIARR